MQKIWAWPLASLLLVVAAACGAPPPYAPTVLTPLIISVTPSVGSIHGGTRISVRGDGIRTGAVLRFGSTHVGIVGSRNEFITPGHTAGSVDVIIDNLDGHTAVLPGGFTYVDSGMFDFNGTWEGIAVAPGEDEVFVRFTVEANVLTQFSCAGEAPFTPGSRISIANGTFSYAGSDGLAVAGHLAADRQAAGRVDIPRCRNADWSASRR